MKWVPLYNHILPASDFLWKFPGRSGQLTWGYMPVFKPITVTRDWSGIPGHHCSTIEPHGIVLYLKIEREEGRQAVGLALLRKLGDAKRTASIGIFVIPMKNLMLTNNKGTCPSSPRARRCYSQDRNLGLIDARALVLSGQMTQYLQTNNDKTT